VRPVLARSIRPARASTSRCLITAGRDTSNRPAICVTASWLSCASRSRIARRVGSASAANARSSWASLKSTIWLSINRRTPAVKTAHFTIACTTDRRRLHGHDTVMAYSFGGYWTMFGPTGWDLDSVPQVPVVISMASRDARPSSPLPPSSKRMFQHVRIPFILDDDQATAGKNAL